MTSVRQT